MFNSISFSQSSLTDPISVSFEQRGYTAIEGAMIAIALDISSPGDNETNMIQSYLQLISEDGSPVSLCESNVQRIYSFRM